MGSGRVSSISDSMSIDSGKRAVHGRYSTVVVALLESMASLAEAPVASRWSPRTDNLAAGMIGISISRPHLPRCSQGRSIGLGVKGAALESP